MSPATRVVPPEGIASVVAQIGVFGGGALVVFGAGTFIRSLHMARILGAGPWLSRQARYRIHQVGANGQPALLVGPDEFGPEAVCSVSAAVWRYRRLPQGSAALLVAGDPGRWAIVTSSDRAVLIVVKRPLLRWWARRLRRCAM
jgi:hypothetical protein